MRFLVLLLSFFFSFSAQAFTVKDFTPQGLIKTPRQARAVFSEPMVSFGDPRAASPFTVSCAEKGKGYWEDSRTWIYEFENELGAGVDCVFTARKEEIKSSKNNSWENPSEFRFTTGAPSVISSDPYDGGTVEEKRAYLLRLDGEVDLASVQENAYFLVEGIPERIPVKILDKKITALLAKKDYQFRQNKNLIPLLIEPTRAFPAGKRIQFFWGKGIRSVKGAVAQKDQTLAFVARKSFTAQFSCERENPTSPCIPISNMSLNFSNSISVKDAAKVMLFSKVGNFKPEISKDSETVSYLTFKAPFPPRGEFSLVIPKGLKDEEGRGLSNAGKFPLKIKTGTYPPLAKFAAPFGILEAEDPVLPVTLRNIEEKVPAYKVDGSKQRLDASNIPELIQTIKSLRSRANSYYNYDSDTARDLRGESLLKEKTAEKFTLPKPNGKEAFEVIGIPLGKKGFHVVELESTLLGKSLMNKNAPMFVAAGALVTNLSVHFKQGNENSLVWVTSLESGKPVSNAKVKIVDCKAAVVWEGKTNNDGIAQSQDLKLDYNSCENSDGDYDFSSGYFVFAEKDDDFSFVHTSWNEGIEAWRFQVPFRTEDKEAYAHTVFDRTLLRAGQTVHMKHVLRDPYLRGLRQIKAEMPKFVVLRHNSGAQFRMPIKFNAMGHAESEWKIPDGAKLGTYSVYLTVADPGEKQKAQFSAQTEEGDEEDYEGDSFNMWGKNVYSSGSFQVEEFRLPVMAGSIQWQKEASIAAKEISADLTVKYLAGGGAAGMNVKIRSRAEKQSSKSYDDFEGFTFVNGIVKVGRKKRNYSSDEEDEIPAEDKNSLNLKEQSLTLDHAGGSRVLIKGIPAWTSPTELLVEAEYKDPSGEIQTISRRRQILPAAALVGLKPDSWGAKADKVKFTAAVVDPDGKPLAGRNVKATWFSRKNFSHRKKIIGGFYVYENFDETKAIGAACEGKTNDLGILICEGKAPATGNLIMMAETEEQGKKSYAYAETYIASGDDWWFSSEDNDRIDLLPERKNYEPNEKARFMVRMPFRKATALVTVEREGIADSFVTELDASDPTFEVPLKGFYAPNIFVSALVVRGRVDDVKPTALVDLGRPAYKLGIAELKVGWKAHELKVAVETDKAEYRVREKAKVKIKVTRALDGKAASGGEVILAAVDEALLELKKNQSWDLLSAMMGNRSLQVATSTAQTQVIGKRHFGLKALPAGGGGGMASTRELFDTLLFWKATIALDKNGEAQAEVPMNDSLSSFKIVAIATEDSDKFGMGAKSVQTAQELMLFSGVVPLAREGDDTNPELTVRNAGKDLQKLTVKGKVGDKDELAAQSFELAPGASKVISWKWKIPANQTALKYEFIAQSANSADAVKVSQKIVPPLRISTLQGTLERVEKKFEFPVKAPTEALPGTASLELRLNKKLAANLSAVQRYMREYPYNCLEQQTSRAVATRDKQDWKRIEAILPSYMDSSGLLKYFPEALYGSDTLTTYILTIAHEAGYAIEASTLARLNEGLSGFITGRNYQAGFVYPAADLSLRKLAAMEALSRYQAFDVKWLTGISIEPELWPLSSLVDWKNLLDREQKIPDREKLRANAAQMLKTRIYWRGSILGFHNEEKENFWWLMGSGDVAANKLLLTASMDPAWAPEIGRMARGVIARMKYGKWDLTTANAWGVLAMERFSEKFEKEEVSGVTEAKLGVIKENFTWGEKPSISKAFPMPKKEGMLSVEHKGKGAPWALIESRAAVPLKEPIFKGYRFERKITPITQKKKGAWHVGDVYRVTLIVDAPTSMTWVALTDPVPAGATILGSGLGGDSTLATKGEKQNYFAHVERSFESYRAYYEWLPEGKTQVQYTVRLNAVGRFQLSNSRVEALYSPEMYGESSNAAITVAP